VELIGLPEIRICVGCHSVETEIEPHQYIRLHETWPLIDIFWLVSSTAPSPQFGLEPLDGEADDVGVGAGDFFND
jgi:hypothetical protein